jgi:hypothetical protein
LLAARKHETECSRRNLCVFLLSLFFFFLSSSHIYIVFSTEKCGARRCFWLQFSLLCVRMPEVRREKERNTKEWEIESKNIHITHSHIFSYLSHFSPPHFTTYMLFFEEYSMNFYLKKSTRRRDIYAYEGKCVSGIRHKLLSHRKFNFTSHTTRAHFCLFSRTYFLKKCINQSVTEIYNK